MPTYCHRCSDEKCSFEWELEYSIKQDPPKICPKCNQETARRMIASAVGGKVELYGQDLKDKTKADANKLKREMRTNENLLHNLCGPPRKDNNGW